MSEDRCIICGEIIPEGRQVCPNCEKQKPMKNLSHGEMVQIAEGKKNKTPRYIDANKLIDLATHEGAYGYVDVHDIQNTPTADVVAVVRCRDCKWAEPYRTESGNVYYFCNEIGVTYLSDGDYCSFGERKERGT
jgi:RNA polymerase subunit RPABC4/transcription elongation factor Spt4